MLCKLLLWFSVFVLFFFCTVWSTLVRISLTKALVLWWCDNKSYLIWFDLCRTAQSFRFWGEHGHVYFHTTLSELYTPVQIILYKSIQFRKIFTFSYVTGLNSSQFTRKFSFKVCLHNNNCTKTETFFFCIFAKFYTQTTMLSKWSRSHGPTKLTKIALLFMPGQ